jgi:hypothetical protein
MKEVSIHMVRGLKNELVTFYRILPRSLAREGCCGSGGKRDQPCLATVDVKSNPEKTRG